MRGGWKLGDRGRCSPRAEEHGPRGRTRWSLAALGITLWTMLAALLILLFWGKALWAARSAPGAKNLADLSLEELMDIPVYGASKYPQKLSEAPASVTTITRKDIQRFGYRTLADILRSVPGFYVTDDRNYSYLGIRGFQRPGDYNTRFLLLVDGHRVNDPIYQMAPIGYDFPLDVDLIDRVEVVRGPSFAIYGSGAFLAVVNVITRRGGELRGVELSGGAAGSFFSHHGRLSWGHRGPRGLEVLFSGSYYHSPGADRLYLPAFSRSAAHCDYESAYNFFTKISFRDFTFTGVYGLRNKGIPTGAYGTAFNDSRNRTVDGLGFFDLKYERTWPGDWGILARVGFNFNTYDGYYWYVNENGPPARILNRDLGRSQWLQGEAQVTKRFLGRHRFIAGLEFHHYLHLDQKNYNAAPWQRFLEDCRQGDLWAVFAQGEFVLTPKLRLFAGVRFDHDSSFGGTVNPRGALIYQPFADTTLKLLYNEGFRAPNAYELYFQDGGVTAKANPHLKPEKIRGLELIWEQKVGRGLWFKTTGYYHRVDGLISQVIDPNDGLAVFRNLMRVEAKGLEVELGGRWRGLEGRLAYSFQETRNLETGLTLSNCPRHLAKLHLTAPLYRDKLFGGVEVLFTSPRRTLTGSLVPAVGLTNLTLVGRNLLPGLELSASVYNLFNQKYYDPGSLDHLGSGVKRIPQDGIGFRLKATYAF